MCIVPGGGGVRGVVERRHSRLLDVEHVWKRLEEDQMIVGMLIKNISEQYVASHSYFCTSPLQDAVKGPLHSGAPL